MLFILLIYSNYLKIKKMDIERNKFEGKFFNVMHLISYSFPIKVFVEENRALSKREEKIKRKIKDLDLDYRFDFRTFLALRFLLLFTSILFFFIILSTIKYYNKATFKILDYIHYLIIALLIPYIPDLYLKKKEREYEKFYSDEIIVLQLFMILLIKSNSTVEDILFAFSKMKTYYKRTFQKAYIMSLRNKAEALSYLEKKFNDTAFGNSFNVLNNMYKYSKKDSIRILNSNLRTIEKESLNTKRKKELTKFSFSQISVVVPFLIVILLGAIPFVQYGINITVNAIQNL